MIGDQQAALVGQACVAPGRGEVHLRHRCVPARQHRARRVPRSWCEPAGQPCLPGAGDAPAAYCARGRDGGGRPGNRVARRRARHCSTTPSASEAVAVGGRGAAGVRVVPAFQGLYAPWWDADGARRDLRAHAPFDARARRAGDPREPRLPDARRRRRSGARGVGAEIPALRIDGGVTANRRPHPGARRRPRPPGRAGGRRRGDGSRCRIRGRARRRDSGTARRRFATCEGTSKTIEPAWDAGRTRGGVRADWAAGRRAGPRLGMSLPRAAAIAHPPPASLWTKSLFHFRHEGCLSSADEP